MERDRDRDKDRILRRENPDAWRNARADKDPPAALCRHPVRPGLRPAMSALANAGRNFYFMRVDAFDHSSPPASRAHLFLNPPRAHALLARHGSPPKEIARTEPLNLLQCHHQIGFHVGARLGIFLAGRAAAASSPKTTAAIAH